MGLTDTYNALLHVRSAAAEFDAQLREADISRAFLFDELIKAVFSDPTLNPGGVFGVWLMHRHFRLKPGEQMVTKSLNIAGQKNTGDITKPLSPSVDGPWVERVERWSTDGTPIEFQDKDDGVSLVVVPPGPLFSEFQKVVSTYNITILGVCLTDRPPDGQVFVEEMYNRKERTQKIEIHPASSVNDADVFETGWSLVSEPPKTENTASRKALPLTPPATPPAPQRLSNNFSYLPEDYSSHNPHRPDFTSFVGSPEEKATENTSLVPAVRCVQNCKTAGHF